MAKHCNNCGKVTDHKIVSLYYAPDGITAVITYKCIECGQYKFGLEQRPLPDYLIMAIGAKR